MPGILALIGNRPPDPPRTEEERERAAHMPRELTFRTAVGFGAILLGALTAILSERLTAGALADLRGAFNVGPDQGSWITAATAMASIAITPLAPFFALVLTIRRLEIGCAALFALFSLLVPLAPSFDVLIGLRFCQGMASGPLVPLLLIVALRSFPPHLRAFGLAGYAFAVIFGPNAAAAINGVLTDVPFLGWEYIFWQNIPLALLTIVGALYGLPREPPQWKLLDGMDVFGLFTVAVALGALTAGVSQGERLDWLDSGFVTGMLTLSAAMLAAFIWHELTAERPAIDLRLFANRNVATPLCLLFVFTFLLLGSGFVLPAFLGEIAGYRERQIGYALIWVALPQVLLTPLVALLLRVIEVRVVFAVGLALMAASFFLSAHVTSDWRWWDLLPPVLMQMLGLPLILVSTLTITTSAVRPDQGPTASALFNTIRALGSTLGASILTEVAATREAVHTRLIANDLVPGDWYVAERLGDLGMSRLQESVGRQALTMSSADLFGILGVLAIGAVLLLLIPRETRVPTRPAAPEAPDGAAPSGRASRLDK